MNDHEERKDPSILGDEDLSSEGISDLLKRGNEVEIFECDRSGNVRSKWLHKPDHTILSTTHDSSSTYFWLSISAIRQAIYDSFLPVGYPHSVSEDYLAYQFYDSLQAFFSTITSLLANRALLQGLGVGDANSSATFAMMLTILKDAMSRIATIVFAHRFGLRIEPDAKRYRFLADLFNDTAFFLELYSPYFGPWGKVVALSTGEALRALCGVAAGASKAALSVHFAKHENLAELNAKEASQETAVGLIGLLVGTVVVKFVEGHSAVLYLMVALVFGHLWVNYRGVCCVAMSTINRQRATLIFEQIRKNGTVPSPREVAQMENILFWKPVLKNQHGTIVGTLSMAESYDQAVSVPPGGQVRVIDGEGFTLFANAHAPDGHLDLRILLHTDSTPMQAVTAWFAALEIGLRTKLSNPHAVVAALHQPKRYTAAFSHWIAAAGWNTEAQSLETGAPIRLALRAAHHKEE